MSDSSCNEVTFWDVPVIRQDGWTVTVEASSRMEARVKARDGEWVDAWPSKDSFDKGGPIKVVGRAEPHRD